ncbi:YtxH domain-containing protein [Macrococcus animalis]|uniref:YtxH domain-containing protein n=1 Tax=Macrococcus animalis TaxID=3395467 RepID=UPI0039BE5130
MKFSRIILGFGVGLAAGAATSIFNAPKSGKELQQNFKSTSYDTKAQVNQLKIEANEVKDYVFKTKDASQEVMKTMADEIRDMIAHYKSDIQPNIENLKGNINNINNRKTEIMDTLSKK